MDFELALRARLKAGVTVGGATIDWGERAQRAGYPAVVLTIVSDPRPRTLSAMQRRRGTRVQIDCMALSYAGKVALRDAVLSVLADRAKQGGVRLGRAIINNVRDMSEEGENDFVHRDMIDATIWHDG